MTPPRAVPYEAWVAPIARYVPQPPAPAGRTCVRCAGPLSCWNGDETCHACQSGTRVTGIIALGDGEGFRQIGARGARKRIGVRCVACDRMRWIPQDHVVKAGGALEYKLAFPVHSECRTTPRELWKGLG